LGIALSAAVLFAACATDVRGDRLTLVTAPSQPGMGCDGAAAAPVRIERDGDAMVFVDVATGQPASMIWPFGFAAWVEYGQAVLYARDGEVVGREGDVLDKIGGSAAPDGFHVCQVGARTYT
jgi:hypothetical protein